MFKCVTYTSLAALDLSEEQLQDVHRTARDLNGIDGISGLLLFNGTHFLQWIEGPEAAIDDLLVRLRRDPRHSGFEVRDERMVEERLFGDWAMNLARVRSQLMDARDDLADVLPPALPEEVRKRMLAMVAPISEPVAL